MTLAADPVETRRFRGFDAFRSWRSGTHLVYEQPDGSYEPYDPER